MGNLLSLEPYRRYLTTTQARRKDKFQEKNRQVLTSPEDPGRPGGF